MSGLFLPVALLAASAPAEPAPAPVELPVLSAPVAETSASPVDTPPAAEAGPSSATPAADAAPPYDGIAGSARRDTMEGLNRPLYRGFMSLDRAVFRPVAMGYKTVVPKPVRDGTRNILLNLNEPISFVNSLAQFKIGRACRVLARFLINSTVGIAGTFDIAKRKGINLPYRYNGLGNTLAFYGVKSGPYLFLPFIGPTTLRDALSAPVDEAIIPLAIHRAFKTWEYQLSTGVVGSLNDRVESDADLRALQATAVDPYATLRSVYLQNRAAEIRELKGGHSTAASPLDDPLADPLADPAAQVAPAKP